MPKNWWTNHRMLWCQLSNLPRKPLWKWSFIINGLEIRCGILTPSHGGPIWNCEPQSFHDLKRKWVFNLTPIRRSKKFGIKICATPCEAASRTEAANSHTTARSLVSFQPCGFKNQKPANRNWNYWNYWNYWNCWWTTYSNPKHCSRCCPDVTPLTSILVAASGLAKILGASHNHRPSYPLSQHLEDCHGNNR